MLRDIPDDEIRTCIRELVRAGLLRRHQDGRWVRDLRPKETYTEFSSRVLTTFMRMAPLGAESWMADAVELIDEWYFFDGRSPLLWEDVAP